MKNEKLLIEERKNLLEAIQNAIDQSLGILGQFFDGDPSEDPIHRDDVPFNIGIEGTEGSGHFHVYIWPLVKDTVETVEGTTYHLKHPQNWPHQRFDADIPSVVLGYLEDLDIFVGFGTGEHNSFEEIIPSIRIQLPFLFKAIQDGISFSEWNLYREKNVLVATRPELLEFYLFNAHS